LVRSKREMILSLGGKALVAMGRWLPSLTDRILEKSLTHKSNDAKNTAKV
jgi:hypothetical protein